MTVYDTFQIEKCRFFVCLAHAIISISKNACKLDVCMRINKTFYKNIVNNLDREEDKNEKDKWIVLFGFVLSIFLLGAAGQTVSADK